MKDLTDDELGRIREVVDGYKVEGDLRRETKSKYQTFNGNFIIPWYSVTVVVYQFVVKKRKTTRVLVKDQLKR